MPHSIERKKCLQTANLASSFERIPDSLYTFIRPKKSYWDTARKRATYSILQDRISAVVGPTQDMVVDPASDP